MNDAIETIQRLIVKNSMDQNFNSRELTRIEVAHHNAVRKINLNIELLKSREKELKEMLAKAESDAKLNA